MENEKKREDGGQSRKPGEGVRGGRPCNKKPKGKND